MPRGGPWRVRDGHKDFLREGGVSGDFLGEGRIGLPTGMSLEREGAYRSAKKDAYEDIRLLLDMFMRMLFEMSHCL